MRRMSAPYVDDFKLLELVRQNKHLYDRYHLEYRDVMKKNITWKAIGAALGASAEVCSKRFRCLRDRFNKERKIRKRNLLNLEDASIPPVYKKMLFLWDHLRHRRATYPAAAPSDGSENAEVVREEIEKQIQILKGGNLLDEAGDSAKEKRMLDLKNEVLFILDETGKLSRATSVNQQQDGVLCGYIVPENTTDEKNCSEQPAQIIFLKSDTKSNLEMNTSSDESNENNASREIQNSPDGSNASMRSKQTIHLSGNRIEIAAKKSVRNQKREILPKSVSKKRKDESGAYQQPNKIAKNKEADDAYEQRNEIANSLGGDAYEQSNTDEEILESSTCQQLNETVDNIRGSNTCGQPGINVKIMRNASSKMPSKKARMVKSFSEATGTCDNQINESASTENPSCNQAFCAVVKNYLDKITSSERLSAARLQILTILHNELYSTYT